jgi:hypothetical protein
MGAKQKLEQDLRKAIKEGRDEDAQAIRDAIAQLKKTRGDAAWEKAKAKQTYQVKEGDSPFSIAMDLYGDERFAQQLLRANPDIYSLRPGMYLYAPSLDGPAPSLSYQEFEDLDDWGKPFAEEFELPEAQGAGEQEGEGAAETVDAEAVPEVTTPDGFGTPEEEAQLDEMADGVVALMKKLGLLGEDKEITVTTDDLKFRTLASRADEQKAIQEENQEKTLRSGKKRDHKTGQLQGTPTPIPFPSPVPTPPDADKISKEPEGTPSPPSIYDPINYYGDTGPAVCEEVGKCPRKDPELDWTDPAVHLQWFASGFFSRNNLLRTREGMTDLEAMAQIVEEAARIYGEDSWDTDFLLALSEIFSGAPVEGGNALVEAAITGNPNLFEFRDTGFHSDFQDGQNQVYHSWPFIVSAASGDIGERQALLGNDFHELYQNSSVARFLGGETADASLNDYMLSLKAIEIGRMTAEGQILPADLGKVLREQFGKDGLGSNGQIDQYEELFPNLIRFPVIEE